jgi:hypothetical protein
VTFTADDARGWLAAAGVEYTDAADCASLADLMAAWEQGRKALRGVEDANAETAKAFHTARSAILTLRRELPTVFAHFMALNQQGASPDIQAEGKKVAALLAAVHVADVRWPSSLPFVSGWHDLAGILMLEYRRITGKGSTSKNGPAVRFIQAALCAVGEHVEPSSIEGALNRSNAPLAARARDALRDRKR